MSAKGCAVERFGERDAPFGRIEDGMALARIRTRL